LKCHRFILFGVGLGRGKRVAGGRRQEREDKPGKKTKFSSLKLEEPATHKGGVGDSFTSRCHPCKGEDPLMREGYPAAVKKSTGRVTVSGPVWRLELKGPKEGE